MARGHKGHPVPVSLSRLILTDVLVSEIVALFAFLPLFIGAIPNSENLEDLGSLIFYALAIALLMLELQFGRSALRYFEQSERWVREGYELAKARPCLVVNPNRMSLTAGVLSMLIAAPIIALWFWLFKFPLIAVGSSFDDLGGFGMRALLFFLTMTVACPVAVVVWRMSVYLAVNLLNRLVAPR